jgi:TRAP-type mannitol/chloroaromatic compound transport system substrate-binding protein
LLAVSCFDGQKLNVRKAMTSFNDTFKRTSMNRRRFLAVGTGAATTLAAPRVARSQSAVRELRMTTAWPKNSAGLGANAQRLADMINAMSGGRLQVRVFAAGELVPPLAAFDAVSDGRAEMMHTTPHFAAGKNPVFRFFGNVPFGLTAHEHAGWLRFGGGQALWEEAYAKAGVQPLLAGTTGPQAGGWFKKEIKSVDDLKGLKMRAGGMGRDVLMRLGVDAILTPPGEIAAAMASGRLDAVEWNGPWNDREAGLHKLAPYYYMPGVLEIGPMLEASINKGVFTSLSPDLQEVIGRAATASAFETYSDFTYHNAVNYEILLKDGVQMRTFPADVVRAKAQATEAILREIAEQSEFNKRVYDSFVSYRKAANRYAEVSDLAQHQARQQMLS